MREDLTVLLQTLVSNGSGASVSRHRGQQCACAAPLAAAFYTFEIMIGAFTLAALAFVAIAALAGTFAADQTGIQSHLLQQHPYSTSQ
ncbi:hypothetical protein [Xanthomonas arboricola]|uniref:hypothetical protein n=1 Tax=Xanthomonas arboricola TaxID=56448 RepID=UPI003183800A